jgi:sigma-54 specific flagellar transcriptional regulator A
MSHLSQHILAAYTWPGNVRELSNFVQRLSVLFAGQTIDLSKIPEEFIPGEMLALLDGLTESFAEFEPEPSVEQRAYAENEEIEASDTRIDSAFDSLESSLQDELSTDFESIIRLSESIDTLPPKGVPTRDILNRLESNLIRTALAQTKGNVSHAAGLLQLGRTTVIQKMAKYEIVADESV